MANIIKNGAVTFAKALMDHEVWHLDPFSRGQAWADLILAANDSNRTFMAGGRPVEVFRGQTGYSLKSLARRWRWSDEKVSGFIQWLERGGMISRKSNGVTTIITVLNYETYNPSSTDTAPATAEDTETDTAPATEPETVTEQKVEVGSKEEGNTPRGPRDLPVELPRGFPSTLEAALAQSAVAGVAPDAVAEIWHAAMAQHGNNWRGQPIRAWAHHVQAEALRLKSLGRGKKPGEKNGHTAVTPENPTARRIRLESQLKQLKEEAEGHIVNCGAPTQEEREDYATLWQKIRDLKQELEV